MSRDEETRFRITTWPGAVETPPELAVPRLVAVVDYAVPGLGEPPEVLDALDRSGFVPAHDRVTDPDAAPGTLRLWVSEEVLAEHPGCEQALYDAAVAVDWPPALVYLAGPPALTPAPDELFLRQLLSVDTNDPDSVVDFVADWGPLLADRTPREASLQLQPRAWTEHVIHHETYRSLRDDDPELAEDLDEALGAGVDIRDILQTSILRFHDRRTAAARLASTHPLDAVLGETWQSITAHELDLLEDDSLHVTSDHGWPALRPVGLEDRIHLVGYSLDAQRSELRIMQALVETWIRLDLDIDLALAATGETPRAELTEPWSSRALPAPTTNFELARSASALLNEAAVWAAPRVELTHPALAAGGGGYGRPLPRIRELMGLQLLAWVADGVPARQCESETCRNLFTRQQGRATAGQRRTAGVRYCSVSCARAQAQREYRRRNRN